MADATQLEIIKEDGVHCWNDWRARNPSVLPDIEGVVLRSTFLQEANFENAKLIGADFTGADLVQSNFRGANLTGAKMVGAKLTKANLDGAVLLGVDLQGAELNGASLYGADLKNAKLLNAKLNGTNLRGANFRNAALGGAEFSKAELDTGTLGLGNLLTAQRSQMTLVKAEQPTLEPFFQDEEDSAQSGARLTIAGARSIIGPANEALQALATPNDLSEERRILFDSLRSSVVDLQSRLAALEAENEQLVTKNEALASAVAEALPLWKRAWENFVLNTAGELGKTAAKGTVFSAGFIAGMLHSAFLRGGPLVSNAIIPV